MLNFIVNYSDKYHLSKSTVFVQISACARGKLVKKLAEGVLAIFQFAAPMRGTCGNNQSSSLNSRLEIKNLHLPQGLKLGDAESPGLP